MSFLRQYLKNALVRNRRVLGNSYDHLFRSATGSLTVEVPEFGGRFEIDIRSHLLRRVLVNGEYEPAVTAFIAANVVSGRDAIDVGANIGFFTIRMLLAGAGRILAVEPMPLAQRFLRQNILNNGVSGQVVVYAGAAGAACGEIAMNYIAGKEEYSSIDPLDHPAIHGMQADCISVPMKTLDMLVEENDLDPAIVKIDTEGSEHRVLQGATGVLEKYRPLVVMESGPTPHREVARILTACNYKVGPLHPGTIVATPR